MEITVILSQENETLPKAELLARLETLDIEYEITSEYPGVITFTTPASEDDIIELGSHLGYTHEILQTIKRTTPEELNNAVKDVDWSEYVNSSFKVRVKRMGNGDVDKDSIERYIGGYIKQQSQMPVDLTNADCTIKLVYTNPKLEVNEFKESKVVGYNEVIITRQIIEQDKKHFFDNKPHKRPYFHPGSMSPKLALCMVNLARTHKGDTVLDPFCGTGGILIEAGLIGCKVVGSDIYWKMKKGTSINLDYYGITDYRTFNLDVRELKMYEKVAAVVTDPPYGISTSTGDIEGDDIFREFFKSIYDNMRDDAYLCMASPHYVDLKPMADEVGFYIVEQYGIKMHRSLTRIITVIRKNTSE